MTANFSGMATSQVELQGTLSVAVSGVTVIYQYQTSGASSYTSFGTAPTNTAGVSLTAPVALPAPAYYNFQAYVSGSRGYSAPTVTLSGFFLTASISLVLVAIPQ